MTARTTAISRACFILNEKYGFEIFTPDEEKRRIRVNKSNQPVYIKIKPYTDKKSIMAKLRKYTMEYKANMQKAIDRRQLKLC
jgi:hypothetical protein